MRKSMFVGMSFLITALVIGCSNNSPEETTVKESISMMNEMAGVLESVKDEKSAKEAESKMKAFEVKGKEIQEKMAAISKDKMETLAKKYETEGKTAADRVGKALLKAMTSGFKIGPTMPDGPK
jgi:hypothetical protein